MRDMQSYFVICRMVRDVEQNQSGTVANGSFAWTTSKKNAEGKWEDQPNFMNFKIFGQQVETAAKFLLKGVRVGLTGTLETESWTSKDGEQKSRLVLIVNNFQLLDAKTPQAKKNVGDVEVPLPKNEPTEEIPF